MASALYAALSTTAAKNTRGRIGDPISWCAFLLEKVNIKNDYVRKIFSWFLNTAGRYVMCGLPGCEKKVVLFVNWCLLSK